MEDHPSQQQLTQYRERVLPPGAFLTVHRHVASCAPCSEKCGGAFGSEEDLADLSSALLPEPGDPPFHLPRAGMIAYVNGRLDEIDLEIAESHLGICADCAREVRRLREAGGDRPAKAPVSSAGLRADRLRPFSLPVRRRLAGAAVAAVLLCLAALLATLLLKANLSGRGVPTAGPERRGEQVAAAPPPEQHLATDRAGSASATPAGAVPTPQLGESGRPTGSSSEVVFRLKDGGREITFDSEGNVKGVEALPGYVSRAIRRALSSAGPELAPDVAQLRGGAGVASGSSDDGLPFRLTTPVGRVVESTRPVFRWSPLAGAESYVVTVTDADLNEVVSSGPLQTTEWRTPRALEPGRTYSWQVTARKDGREIVSPALPAPQAKFRVLETAKARELERARREVPDSHLALGVLYARAGLFGEAEREFQLLLSANPRSRVARRLLSQVRSLKGG